MHLGGASLVSFFEVTIFRELIGCVKIVHFFAFDYLILFWKLHDLRYLNVFKQHLNNVHLSLESYLKHDSWKQASWLTWWYCYYNMYKVVYFCTVVNIFVKCIKRI